MADTGPRASAASMRGPAGSTYLRRRLIETMEALVVIDLVPSVTDRQAGKDPCPPVLAIAQQIVTTLPK